VFSADELGIIRELLDQLGPGKSVSSKEKDQKHDKNSNKCKNAASRITLNPPQLLIIAGFLSGALNVESVLVDRDQKVKVLLSGTLKRKTEFEEIMAQIGQQPFEQVIRAIMEHNL
jgi:hypothetical protein